MFWSHQLFFWRTGPGGRREISWRTWLLIWLLPGLFLGAGALMLAMEGYRHLATVPATGEVVRVHAWPGSTIFDRGATSYVPVFRYVWSDGTETEAAAGMAHPDWNLEVGSVHEIRYFPSVKTDVVLPGAVNFYAGLIVAAMGLVLLLPAMVATRLLRRWQGTQA